MSSDEKQTKRELLAHLREKEAITSNPALEFELKKQIEALETELADANISPTATPTKIWTVPHTRNPYFTAREDALQALHRALHEDGQAVLGQTQAISGLGGIGKTQTAVEYAYRHRDDYDAIFWTLGQTEGDLVSGFEEIARELGLAGEDPEQRIAAIHRWMREHESWLLVVDNADEPDLLRPYLPSGAKGHVLLTSRARYFGALAIPDPLQLDTLAPDHALAFLLKRAGRKSSGAAETKAACALAEELGYLPLALEQASAYLAAKQTRFEDYLAAYRKRRGGVLERSRPEMGDYPHGVAETWLLNFEAVEAISEASADVLRVSAFLAPDLIPEELLLEGTSELGSAIAEKLGDSADSLTLDELLEPISRYSLIRRIPRERAFGVHRLVQEVVQNNLDPASSELWIQRAVRGLNQSFPYVELDNWDRCARFVPHVVAVSEARNLSSQEEAGRLLDQAGLYLKGQARYSQASSLCERALRIREKALGEEHPHVAQSLNNLAMLHHAQGEYPRAKPLCERALKIRERALGEEHPHVAQSLNDLALLHHAQGEYPQAASLCERALKIRENVLGEEHPHVAQSLNNLGSLHHDQCEFMQAKPLFERALRIREKVLGEVHPHVAQSLNDLAMLHQDRGEYTQAKPLFERALGIREKVLGEMHPDVAQSLNDLALLHQDQCQYTQAKLLFERALRIREKVLGEVHPDVAQSLNNLAGLYQDQSEFTQAKLLYERALRIREEVLGEEHPDVAQSLNNLALLHKDQDEHTQAKPLYERALKILEKALGEEHPDVATSLNNLARLHKDQSEYTQAKLLYERALKIDEKMLGKEHPGVAFDLNNLARLHQAQGEYTQAKSLYERALKIFERALGHEHPYTETVRENYASLSKS